MVLLDIVEGSKEVEFDVEICWCCSDVNFDFYDIGLELIDLINEFLDVVDWLVEDCLFKEQCILLFF